MSVRSVLGFSLGVVVLAPFSLAACDGLKKDGAPDAAAAPVVAPATPAAPAAPDTGNAAAATPVAPLGATQPAAAGVKPAAADGGKPVAVVDGGAAPAALADGGKAAPAPTPTFALPTAIPPFDAGGFKPPAGFPSTIPTTLPTFPPPAK